MTRNKFNALILGASGLLVAGLLYGVRKPNAEPVVAHHDAKIQVESAQRDETADALNEHGSPAVQQTQSMIEELVSLPASELEILLQELEAESDRSGGPDRFQREWDLSRGWDLTYERLYWLQPDYLESLAANGDRLAMQTLGRLKIGTDEGRAYSVEAIQRGSINALYDLKSAAEMAADGRFDEVRPELTARDRNAAQVESLAYVLVASRRGDNFLAPNSAHRLNAKYKYSSQEVQEACHYANVFFDDLIEKREAAGLPDFDNSQRPGSAKSARLSPNPMPLPYAAFCSPSDS